MPLSLSAPDSTPELQPRIVVIGVGGAGGNAVNNMIAKELEGVDFIAANTDAQALARSRADRRVQLGGDVTLGLGAGARPEVGEQAAGESIHEIMEHIEGANMVFVTAGMGGGTGTGAAPVIARAAREQGILTVGVVTKPFQFEGPRRMRLAEAGVEELEKNVDTLIVIPNQNLFRVATETTSFADAFVMADDVLHSGVRAITDLIVRPGIVNRDFADVRTTMSEMGRAMIGMGEAEGERRAAQAAEAAINNPLLDDTAMKGAQRVLISFTHGPDFTLHEIDEAANIIAQEADEEAQINWGSTLDETMEGKLRLSVIPTGIGDAHIERHARTAAQPAAAPARPVAAAPSRPAQQAAKPATPSMPWRSESTVKPVEPSAQPRAVGNAKTAEQIRNEMRRREEAEQAEAEAEPAAAERVHVEAPRPAPQPVSALEETDEPNVRELNERVREEAPTIRRPAETASQPQEEKKGGFSLFGFRNNKHEPEEKKEPQRPNVRVASGDLFNGLDDDDLEIPAFLRRQAN